MCELEAVFAVGEGADAAAGFGGTYVDESQTVLLLAVFEGGAGEDFVVGRYFCHFSLLFGCEFGIVGHVLGELLMAGLLRTADFGEASELLVDMLLNALLTDRVRTCGELMQDSIAVANGALLWFGLGENDGEEVWG
jgi:hypothetical protein